MRSTALISGLVALLCTINGAAQAQEVKVVAPGERYGAGSFHQWLFGSGYRDLWITPVRVPELDLRTVAGGLKPVKEGGGRQTRTLHLRGGDGRAYVFRSVDKYVEKALPSGLAGSTSGALLQDEISLFNPSGAPMVPPLLSAVGVLHAVPRLYVMPDDARLGEFRSSFAGILGYLEERPEEGADDAPGFANSKKIVGIVKLREQLLEDSHHRLEERDWLAARLIDFLIGDTDRGGSQWRFARYKADDGFRWRPIPRDRDFAFIHANGVGPRLVELFYKRLVTFDEQLPPLNNMTFTTLHHDRAFLQSLDESDWMAITSQVQAAITSDVIDAAVHAMPPEHYALRGERMAAQLRERRSALMTMSRRYYAKLAEHVDVHGSEQNERAEIRRYDDGSVDVILYHMVKKDVVARAGSNGNGQNGNGQNGHATDARQTGAAFYKRRFMPDATDEVRIYLYGGDDSAVVIGSNTDQAIKVRIVGGDGDDALVDSSTKGDGGTHTWLYDDEGSNLLRGGRHTDIDQRSFTPPVPIAQAITIDKIRYRDWGSKDGFGPWLDFRANTGFILGAQYTDKQYGFRRVPFESQWRARLMYAPGAGAFGAEIGTERHFENSGWSVFGNTRASGYDNLRFFGYGNDAPEIDTDEALVEWQRITAKLGLRYMRGPTDLAFGLASQISDTPVEPGSPLAFAQPLGIGDWTQHGLWATAATAFAGEHARISADGGFYPAVGTLDEAYGTALGTAIAYIGSGPILALRVIGEKVWGNAPFQDAAFIGGRRSLRGYSSYRFAGDASLLGNAELRVPIRGEKFGVIALGDAGRVYVDGASPGDWHTAYGGGFWVAFSGHAVSALYANGEDHKFYVMLGMPF